MQKAFTYYRVSTEEQAKEGISLDSQQRQCRKWAKENNYKIVKEFFDKGKSATTLNRPALKELISLVEDENVSALIIFDTDRLARNTFDHLTVKSILQKYDVKVISINQPMIDDSPEGKMIDTIIASVNAFQSDITARKTSKNLEEKAKEGWLPCLPPIGYINIANPTPKTKYDKKIIGVNEPIAPYISKAFKRYAKGIYSVPQILAYLKENNVEKHHRGSLGKNTIRTMLSNKFYLGEFVWGGKTYSGKHTPLTDPVTFNKVQSILATYKTRNRTHIFLLNGFLYSKTNKRLYGEKHEKKSGKIFSYYKYKDTLYNYYDSETLEKQVEQLFETIQITKDYVKYVLDLAKKMLREYRSEQILKQKEFTTRKVLLEKAVKNLEDDRFVNCTIDSVRFNEIYSRFENERDELEDKLKECHKDYTNNLKRLQKILVLTENIGQLYKSADLDKKKAYINLFFEKLIVGEKEIEEFILKPEVKGFVEDGSVRIRSQWGG